MLEIGQEWVLYTSPFRLQETTTPEDAEVPSGVVALYAKDKAGTSALYLKDDAGNEREVGQANLVTGTGTANRLAYWTSASVLAANAALTQGHVLFADANGLPLGDTSLFWDNTNKRLGLGTSAPTSPIYNLHIADNTATPGVIIDGLNQTGAPSIVGRGSRGTLASPTATQADDTLLLLGARGRGATGYSAAVKIALSLRAAENWTDSAQGTFYSIFTTATGGTTLSEKFRIGPSGQWGIGGATYGSSGDIFSSGGASAAPTWVSRATLNAALDHGTLGGLTDDDHAGYALLAGRSGGQDLIGGTADDNRLNLRATSHSEGGYITLGNHAITHNSDNDLAVAYIGGTFNGTGSGLFGLQVQPTYNPSASITFAYGMSCNAIASPGSTITITEFNGLNFQNFYSDVAGAVTTAYALNIRAPLVFGALKPATNIGVGVGSQGASGMTTAIGLHIDAQSGATNNFDLSFGRVDTTAAGAYYGRIPTLYNGLLKYMHVFDP